MIALPLFNVGDRAYENPVFVALAKLERIHGFRDGWAYGQGVAFSENVYNVAKRLLNMAQFIVGCGGVDVFPGRHGQIIVTFYKGRESYNFVVANDNVQVIRESEDGDEQNVSIPLALSVLLAGVEAASFGGREVQPPVVPQLGIGYSKWNSYESCIQTNMNPQSSDFAARLLNLTTILGTSPSFQRAAPFSLPRRSAGT
jgi:hypothetical protein